MRKEGEIKRELEEIAKNFFKDENWDNWEKQNLDLEKFDIHQRCFLLWRIIRHWPERGLFCYCPASIGKACKNLNFLIKKRFRYTEYEDCSRCVFAGKLLDKIFNGRENFNSLPFVKQDWELSGYRPYRKYLFKVKDLIKFAFALPLTPDEDESALYNFLLDSRKLR